jgi:tetratricopeptide (TPR) repeat protein
MGVSPRELVLTPSYELGREALEDRTFALLVAEASQLCSTKKGSQESLIHKFRNLNPHGLVLVIGPESSLQVLSEPWIGEADLFLPKPIIPKLICEAITQALEERQKATESFQSFRETLERGRVDEAIRRLETSRLPDQSFGLLVALYDRLLEQKSFGDAFRVLRSLLKKTPSDPKRIQQAFQLAVITQDVQALPELYHFYRQCETREVLDTKSIAQALLWGGKRKVADGDSDLGMELFHQAILASNADPKILRQVVLSCAENQLTLEARAFLLRLPIEPELSAEYRALELAILEKTAEAGVVLHRGWQLLSEELRHPLTYEILIRNLRKLGKFDPAENLAYDAIRRWPEQRESFQPYVSTDTSLSTS